MSRQNQILTGTVLLTSLGLGLAQTAYAAPLPEQVDTTVSQATVIDYDNNDVITTTRVPGKVVSTFGDEFVRVQLPDETRLVVIGDDAFETRRIVPGSDVIVTMQGDRIIHIALATEADLLALENEQEQETAWRVETETNVAPPERIVQTERVQRQQVIEQRQEVRPVTQPVQPIRAMW